jgi:hypothetical protein
VAVLISSRSFTEYLAMFGLDSADLIGRTVAGNRQRDRLAAAVV